MSTPKTILGWPKGSDNIHGTFELPPGTLRLGKNVDILDSGKLRRRKGSVQSIAATATHSLWENKNVSLKFYVSGSTMYSLSDALVSTAIVTGLASGAKIAYVEVNGEVFWSNGYVTGKIVNGVNYPLGVETPAKVTVAATVGSLPAGRYQLTTTFRSLTGEEGGAQNYSAIDLLTAGGIALTNMSLPQSSDVTTRCIYLTLANSEVMYKIATLPAATTSHSIANMPVQGVALRTMDTRTMPAGSVLAHRNGILYVADGNTIYHSEPMRYGQCNVTKNFYMYPSPVTVMLATPDGLYVCADKAYFLESPGTVEVVQRIILPIGGIAGTGVYLPDSTDVAWFTPKGQAVASGGQAKLISEDTYVPGVMVSGASFVREQEGVKQIVNVVHLGDANPLEFTGV